MYEYICKWYKKMLDWGGCIHWTRVSADSSPPPPPPENFSLPSPTPQWPQGQGFATGRIHLGEIEVVKITKFQLIWGYNLLDKKKSVAFYKPIEIPDGYCSLGHYCRSNDQPLRGFLLVAREINLSNHLNSNIYNKDNPPALLKPLDYTLIWSSEYETEGFFYGSGYFWIPQPPEGYKSMGFLVTNSPVKPDLGEIRCVRADLTEKCENYRLILDLYSNSLNFRVWKTRPLDRGMLANGVSVGTFFCSNCSSENDYIVPCLKNLNSSFTEMPNYDQIHSLINHYGPTLYFHPDEIYFPSSVSWFFKNGALLYKKGGSKGEPIDMEGSNLPLGGSNDKAYWIDLPYDDKREIIKKGNLESAVLYVHVKPALGGTFTDIVMWVFCPYNGPATIKIGITNFSLKKVGRHVSDWEHFTLRICNFTGELSGIYFSQHSGGEWVDASDLEYINENKSIIYSSKNGHASFPHAGNYLQGSSKLGIGIRNDAARSNYYVDSSKQYEIIAAEYLGNIFREPCWLQYMRQWGPRIVYDSRTELDKVISFLPMMVRFSVENIFNKFPVELYGEEGPTGPKEKNNWLGDERW